MRQVLKFDLDDETQALRGEHGWRENGHSAKTLVKHHDQRIVLIAMKQGRIAAGQLLALDRGLPHDVEATQDSSLVLSMCCKARKRSVAGVTRSK
jgi:hypothetical protein